MQKQTRSLLSELTEIANKKDINAITESRAVHIIESAINMINTLKNSFEPDVALDLERRLISSIKTSDPKKFVRGIRRIRK